MAQAKTPAAPRQAAPAALATEARALSDALHILDDLAAAIAGAELLMAQGATAEESRADHAAVDALLGASKVASSRVGDLARSFDEAALAANLARARHTGHVRALGRTRLDDMARQLLEMRGIRTTMMSGNQIITRALNSTSDFPNLLGTFANAALLQGYNAYTGGVKSVARQGNAPDFRPLTKLKFGEAPKLTKVLEGGEFKRVSISDSKETYSIATWGKIFGISRQALVNDQTRVRATRREAGPRRRRDHQPGPRGSARRKPGDGRRRHALPHQPRQ
jgi:hypothetical protein